MNGDLWLAFVVLVSAVVLTPGPSVLLVTAHGASYGFRPTLATICGDLSANVCQMTLATIGLGVIRRASPVAFEALKWVGVMYLVFLGTRMWLQQARPSELVAGSASRMFRRLYVEGFMASALNPKALFFFFALFPQFLDREYDLGVQCVMLGLTFVCLDGLALIVYTRCAARLRVCIDPESRQRLTGRLGGTIMIAAAILLACWHG